MIHGEFSNLKHSDKTLSDGTIVYNSGYIYTNNLERKDYDFDFEYVNDNYYYNYDDNIFYKSDDTKEKEITSGDGLKKIYYADNTYYVLSGTGYFYAMNENFETIIEPFKSEINGTSVLGNNCFIKSKSESFNDGEYSGQASHFYLYNYNNELIEDLGADWGKIETDNFIATLVRMSTVEYNERTGNRDTHYLGSQTRDVYVNLNTGETLKIYK